MLKLGIITDQISMDFEKALKFTKELGLEYIEIHALWNKNIEELTDEEVAKAKSMVDKYNLKVSLISSTLFLQCPLDEINRTYGGIDDYFITISGNYNMHIKALQRCINLCKIFDTNRLRTFGFIKEKEYNDETVVKKIVERLKMPVAMVEDAGLTLLLENCPHTYLQFGALTKRVIETMGSKKFKALWDPGNDLRSGGKPYPDDYMMIREHMDYVHAKDVSLDGGPHMVPIGEGVINYREILKSLMDDGFDGIISLEPEYVDLQGGRPEGCEKSLNGILKIIESI